MQHSNNEQSKVLYTFKCKHIGKLKSITHKYIATCSISKVSNKHMYVTVVLATYILHVVTGHKTFTCNLYLETDV